MKRIIYTLIFVIILVPLFGCHDKSPSFTIGAEEIILSKEERFKNNLDVWPDGCLGVTKDGEKYCFYGANGNRITKTTGTLDNLAAAIDYTDKKLIMPKENFNYASGGPVYETPDGDLILIYHAESHYADYKHFYSTLGMAISKDNGNSFRDLGEIITPNISDLDPNCPDTVEMGGGCYVVHGDYMYVYFRDCLKNGDENNLCAARASVSEIVRAATKGHAPEFKKYHNGAFSEDGIGGRSSNLEEKNINSRWTDISFNTYINKFIIAGSQSSLGKTYLYIMFSDDGINWSKRYKIESEAKEMFYPTIIGQGDNPKETGKEFYIYYTASSEGEWERWNDAYVARRLITLE